MNLLVSFVAVCVGGTHSEGKPCTPAVARSVRLGIPNKICLRIEENGNFASAQ